jgi:hypothetical protein
VRSAWGWPCRCARNWRIRVPVSVCLGGGAAAAFGLRRATYTGVRAPNYCSILAGESVRRHQPAPCTESTRAGGKLAGESSARC